jgi:hypothetical protein
MTAPIVAAGSVDLFFHEIVENALRARSVDVTEGTEHYLVSLLTTFTRPDPLAAAHDKPLAFQLDEALHIAEAGARFDRLRALGDGVLYSSGFFGDHFEARGIDAKYLVGIGTTAYGAASSMLRGYGTGGGGGSDSRESRVDIFGEMSAKFAALVAVLCEVANHTIASGVANAKQIVKLYERYLKTRSPSLEKALTSHGLVPQRGGKGILQ